MKVMGNGGEGPCRLTDEVTLTVGDGKAVMRFQKSQRIRILNWGCSPQFRPFPEHRYATAPQSTTCATSLPSYAATAPPSHRAEPPVVPIWPHSRSARPSPRKARPSITAHTRFTDGSEVRLESMRVQL